MYKIQRWAFLLIFHYCLSVKLVSILNGNNKNIWDNTINGNQWPSLRSHSLGVSVSLNENM
ncbi:hypothetical protein RND81_04G037000 [Saponaria officinalis]|uniref:Uncharacterized protein n=1 Tax=Saponaria officinalis TaxID=3572 RepID=A0AAW1LHE4_SAPOF